MNVKLSKKDLKDKYVVIGDENLVNLCNLPKLGYNAGTYGWNWTAYTLTVNTVVICGYRSFPAEDLKLGYDWITKFYKKYHDKSSSVAKKALQTYVKKQLSK